VTVLYFDTSALVKLYVRERGSAAAASLFDAPESLILVSEIAFLEMDSALYKKVVREEIDVSFARRRCAGHHRGFAACHQCLSLGTHGCQ